MEEEARREQEREFGTSQMIKRSSDNIVLPQSPIMTAGTSSLWSAFPPALLASPSPTILGNSVLGYSTSSLDTPVNNTNLHVVFPRKEYQFCVAKIPRGSIVGSGAKKRTSAPRPVCLPASSVHHAKGHRHPSAPRARPQAS
jgi:hypothetical protein